MESVLSNFHTKRVGFSYNNKTGVILQDKSEEAFFASGNKIVVYNFTTGMISEIYKLNCNLISKILKLKESSIVILTIANEIVVSCLKTNETKMSLKIKSESQIINGMFINETLVLINKTNKLIFLDKNFEIVDEWFDKDLSKTNIYSNFMIHTDRFLYFNHKNILIQFDLTSKTMNKKQFPKMLTSGCAINNSCLAIGDNYGKIHFIFENETKTATKHWHSHKVSALVTDQSSTTLYSVGQEGVIVVWNLLEDTQTFIPRVGSPISEIYLSPQGKFLCLLTQEGSLKFLQLSNTTFLKEYVSISNQQELSYSNNSFSDEYLTALDKSRGSVRVINLFNNKISIINFLNKNFCSQTEMENINYKQMTHALFLNNKKIVTVERIKDGSFLEVSMKLYDFSKDSFTVTLLCTAPNPHLNYEIENIVEISDKNSFVSIAKCNFKIWQILDEKLIKCVFEGEYKNTKICGVVSVPGNFVSLNQDDQNNFYFVYYSATNRKIASVKKLNFIPQVSVIQMVLLEGDRILLYNENAIYLCESGDLIKSENFSKGIISNLKILDQAIWIDFTNEEDVHTLVKYDFNLNKENSFVLKKKNLILLQVVKNEKSFVAVNKTNEIFLLKKESILGKKTKQRSRQNSVEFRKFSFEAGNLTEKIPTKNRIHIEDDFENIFENNLTKI